MATAIITDLNRCVGCLACATACKGVNNVPIGNYWNKVVRVGPNPIPGGSGDYPDVYMYFLPISCQHCENPECVKVCPTEASHVAEDGSIQVDKDKCTGCGACANICPKHVIMIDAGGPRKPVVMCSNQDKGAVANKLCTTSCIACGMCERTCKFDAIHVVDGVARIDYDKCCLLYTSDAADE